jgi:chromosome segregation ATPase
LKQKHDEELRQSESEATLVHQRLLQENAQLKSSLAEAEAQRNEKEQRLGELARLKEEDFTQLKSSLEASEQKVSNLQKELLDRDAALQTALGHKENFENTLAESKTSADSALRELSSRLQEKEAEAVTNGNALIELRESLNKMEAKLNETELQLGERTTQLESENQAKLQAESSRSSLENRIVELENTLSTCKDESATLHSTKQELQSRIDAKDSELRDVHSELQRLRENIGQLESKLNESEGQLRERSNQLESEMQTKVQAENSKTSLEQRVADMEKTIAACREEAATLQNLKQELQSRLDAKESEFQQFNSDLQRSRENISNLESKLNESEAQLKERASHLDSEVQTRLQAENSRTFLEQRVAELERTIATSKYETSALDLSNKELQVRLDSKESELQEVCSNLQKTNVENANLQRKLDEILAEKDKEIELLRQQNVTTKAVDRGENAEEAMTPAAQIDQNSAPSQHGSDTNNVDGAPAPPPPADGTS